MDKLSNGQYNENPSGSVSNEEKYYEMEDETTRKKEENLNIDLNTPKINDIKPPDNELNELPDVQINETSMINTLKEPVAVTIVS